MQEAFSNSIYIYIYLYLYTGCIKMIGAVLKLIIFTSMVNRIINTSRNERITQQVYDTYLQMFDVCTLRHTAHIEAIVQFLPYSAQKVRCDGLHSRGNSVLQIRYAHGLWWHKHCGDHHTWLSEQSMAGIGLSPRCVPCDEGCIHRTFVGMCHKLVELLFQFY